MQRVFNDITPFLELTRQQLNVSKIYVFGTGRTPPHIVASGSVLPTKAEIKILRIILRFNEGNLLLRYADEELEWGSPTAALVRGSSLPFWARATVLSSILVGKVLHGGEFRQLTVTQERTIRTVTTTTLWKKVGKHRSPAVINTLLVKGHTVDIGQASLIQRWMGLRRLIRNDARLADYYWRCIELMRDKVRVLGKGPVEALVHAARRLGITWTGAAIVRIEGKDFNLFNRNVGELGHALRQAARKMVWSQARQDAARGTANPEHVHLLD